MRDLVTEVTKAGTAASLASPVLAAALNKQIEAAKTKNELALVTAELERARAAGKLFGSDAADALDKVKRKAEELSPALQQARRDAELLGVTLKDKIGQGANAGVEASLIAYERLKASGKASTEELGQAFASLANKAIKEAGGIVPEWVKVEAAIRGATIETDKTGRAFVRVRELADSQIGGIVGIFNGVTDATKRAEDAALRYGSALQSAKYDADKFAVNGNGQRFEAGGNTDRPLGQGISPGNLGQGISPGNLGQGKLVRQVDLGVFTPTAGRATSSTPSGNGTGSSHTVTINLGGRKTGINAASAADAQQMVDLMQQLETAMRNAGG